MKSIDEMNKGELQEYAERKLQIKIDMRKSIETLREELAKYKPETQATEAVKPQGKATHLKNKTTGFFWPWSKLLEERGDLIPCDENGDAV